MKKTKYIILFVLIAFLAGCKDTELFNDTTTTTTTPGQRTMTIKATMPIDESMTRSITQDAESLDILLRWQVGDSGIKLIFKQGDNIIEAAKEASIKAVEEEGKVGIFDVEVPEQIDTSKPFDLYGVTSWLTNVNDGKIQAGVQEYRITLPDYTRSTLYTIPVWFQIKNINAIENVNVSFRHLGSLAVITIKNKTGQAVSSRYFSIIRSNEEDSPFYYEYHSYLAPFVDLLDFNSPVEYQKCGFVHQEPILSLTPYRTTTFVQWICPNGNQVPEAVVEMGNIRSVNTLSPRPPLKIGQAYHVYAVWDGDNLTIVDEIEEDDPNAAGPLTWTFEDGILTVRGNEDMLDYDTYTYELLPPWNEVKSEIVEIIIEDGVTSIGNFSFFNCPNLLSVFIPNSVIRIGDRAFLSCSKLEEINLPHTIVRIEDNAFFNTKIKKIFIPKYCNYIGGGFVSECRSLSSIEVDFENETYQSIDGVLVNKKEGKLIAYPNGKETEHYITPNGVREIIRDAFYGGNQYLKYLTVSEGVESIGSSAFGSLYALEEANLPASLIKIEGAFVNNARLQSIHFHESNKNYSSLDGVFFNKTKSKLIKYPQGRAGDYIIPETVSELEGEAFRNSVISNVTIPNTISTLPNYVFFSCRNLQRIEIQESVSSIGYYAFAYCTELVNVKVRSSIPPLIYQNTFIDINKNICTLEVPAGSLDAYKEAPYWNEFVNIVEF